MLATPVLVAGLYMAGAAVTHTKVPIYGLLAFQHAVLTHRFWRVRQQPGKNDVNLHINGCRGRLKYQLHACAWIQTGLLFLQLLKTPEVFLFPFFCVAVNLGFIVLLNLHASDPVLNPLFQ